MLPLHPQRFCRPAAQCLPAGLPQPPVPSTSALSASGVNNPVLKPLVRKAGASRLVLTRAATLTPPASRGSTRPQEVLQDIAEQYSPESNRPMVLRQLEEFCKSLADELNSTKVHFVNELVQNADDNSYAPGVIPKLSLKIEPHGMTTTCNELGFAEQNVRAICATRMSSKSKASGHTGEKGIGFKSVFAVADHVYIHSNDYCFMFDSQAKLGYLRPVPVNPSNFPVPVARQGTTMYLRFKPGFDYRTLLAELTNLRADFMVFLKKVRCLELVLPDTTLTYSVKSEAGSDIVALEQHSSTGTAQPPSLFLMVSERVEVPSEAEDGKRAGVASTTLALAFPLDAQRRAAPRADADAFATLPIGRSGFRFMLQGDFVVSMNRESILQDRPWNLFLRDQLTHLLLGKALATLIQHPDVCTTFLAFMPLGGEVGASSFFAPTAAKLGQGLASMACVPSASSALVQPASILLPSPQWALPDGTPLITNGMLQQLHGSVEYCHPVLLEGTQEDRVARVLQHLGARVFGVTEMATCLTHPSARSLLATQPNTWLLRLYQALAAHDASQQSDNMEWPTLAENAPIFRVRGSPGTATAAGLMISDGSTFSAAERDIFSRLRFLAEGTYDSGVLYMLSRRFDIQVATAEVLGQHILGLYPSIVNACTDEELRQHVQFLHRRNIELGVADRSRLQLRQACNCGPGSCSCRVYATAAQLSLPLDPTDQHLAPDLSTAGVRFLHRSYFAGLPAPQAESLRVFFSNSCGVRKLDDNALCSWLLKLYKEEKAPEADRNLEHLWFIQQHISELYPVTRQSLPDCSLVMDESGEYAPGHSLYQPLEQAEDRGLVVQDLAQAGLMRFCSASAYQAAWAQQPMLLTFMQQYLRVKPASVVAVVQALAKLHGMEGASSTLTSTQLDNHLRFLLRNRWLLTTSKAGIAASRQLLVRTAGGGPPLPSAHPVFLPLDAQYADVEGDLRQAGMTFVHPEVCELITAAGVSPAELDKLLGIRAPSPRDVIDTIVTLYSQGPKVLCATRTRAQLLMLLRFLSQHTDTILADAQLLHRVRAHVFVRAAVDSSTSAGSKVDESSCYALGKQLALQVGDAPAGVQRMMERCGLRMVDEEYLQLDAPVSGGNSSSTSNSKSGGSGQPLAVAGARSGAATGNGHAFLTRVLRVEHLTQNAIARMCLAESKKFPVAVQHALTDAELMDVARYVVAAAGPGGSTTDVKPVFTTGAGGSTRDIVLEKDMSYMLVRVSRGRAGSEIRDYGAPGSTYMPSQGEGWSLQQLLLPGEVTYLHPEWAAGVSELAGWLRSAPAPVLVGRRYTLGPDLQRLVQTNNVDRNMALLGMLRDMLTEPEAAGTAPSWPCIYSTPAAATWRACLAVGATNTEVCNGLGGLTVRVAGGEPRPLRDCFVRSSSLLLLLGSSAPYVDVPEPDQKGWEFLAHLGAQTVADAPTLISRLQQLRDGGGIVDLEEVSTLYHHLGSMSARDPETRQAVVEAFSEPLTYLPPNQQLAYLTGSREGPDSSPRGEWVSSSHGLLCWQARFSRSLLPGVAVLEKLYPNSRVLFTDILGVRDGQASDLGLGLQWLAAHNPSGRVCATSREGKALRRQVLDIYQALAETLERSKGEAPGWLGDLMQEPILLVRTASDTTRPHLSFVSPSPTRPVYLADDPQLASIFHDAPGIQLLAVPTSELPALRPLLQLCQQPVRPLLAAVSCATESSGQGLLLPSFSGLMNRAAEWVARAAYPLNPSRFTAERLEDSHLPQLCSKGLTVYHAQDITQTYTLENHERTRNVDAALAVCKTAGIRIYVDNGRFGDMDELLEALSRCYAGLWMDSNPAFGPKVDKILDMLWKQRSRESMNRWFNSHQMAPLPPHVIKTLGITPWTELSDLSESDGEQFGY